MMLQRKILCITNAALLGVSVYASAPESVANQAPVPAVVAGANWMGTFKTMGVAAVSSAGTYYVMDEINRRMNMGIQNPYLTSTAAMVAAISLYSAGGLFAAAPTQHNSARGQAARMEQASPSRQYTTQDVKARLQAVRQSGFWSSRQNPVIERTELENIARTLNEAVTFLQHRKDHYKMLSESMKEKLDQADVKIENLVKANTDLMVEAGRHEGKDSRIKELLSQITRLQESWDAEVRSRSQQQADAGAAILKLNSEISSLRSRLERAQSTCGSVADQSEYARSEAGRSVASTMRRNVETFFGEILERDERDILRTALADYRIKKIELKKREEEDSRAETQAAEQALDDVC